MLFRSTFDEDPHPEPPKCFLDAPKVDKLVREIQAHHGPRQENELPQLEELQLGKPSTPASQDGVPAPGEANEESKPAWPPKPACRSCSWAKPAPASSGSLGPFIFSPGRQTPH